MTGEPGPRVFTIAPAAPFLPTLVDALLDGVLVPGRVYRDDPLRLADVTLYLPTRRAARALSETFLAALGGRAAVLPRIRPLGDVDEDVVERLADPTDLDLPPAISEPERVLGLAQLIADWRRHVSPDRTVSPSGERIRVPSSTSEAVHLARDLLALMDQAAAESVDWSKLVTLVPDDYAAWWQLTLTFLTIATEAWPAFLAERGQMDPVARRTRVITAIAERLEREGARGPVIAAGSTGSLPTTARLLAAIARQPNGAVVLPGLDLGLDDETWSDIAPDGAGAGGIASHPQAAMARLLHVIGVGRNGVAELGSVSEPMERRLTILSEAMRPAESTDRWKDFAGSLDPDGCERALDGMTLVVGATEAEEALAAALALREAIEAPGRTAALVTPDRGLARRVCTELARFGVDTEDSAGTPLERTPTGILVALSAECAVEGLPPEKLVALLKHPLACFGFSRPRCRAAARALEIAVLRGPRLATGSKALMAAAETLARAGRKGQGVPKALAALGEERLADARMLARRIGAAVMPIEALKADGRRVDLKTLLQAHLELLQAIAADETGDDSLLFDGPAGTAAAEVFAGYLDSAGVSLDVTPGEYPATLAALMAGRMVRRTSARPARVFIWGPLEARLLGVDRLVVGGLNEGTWPLATDTGPWLSRPMRADLAFGPPEQRIGLSAHDFVQSLGTRDVVLTRSEKRDGAPTVPTRFLQRFTSVIGEARSKTLRARGDVIVDWARRLDDIPPVPRPPRPEPRPPLAARPKQLSVTEIETWIRDPYAVYARRVLDLQALEGLGEQPDFGARGSAVHQALADFAKDWTGPFDQTAVAALIEAGRLAFKELEAYPEVHALWWPRFVAAAGYVVESFEAGRADMERNAEIRGRWVVVPGEDGFALTGRADRIDITADGLLSLVDFKTGSAPSERQIAALKSPQMPLEAVIAQKGGFEGIPPRPLQDLVHVVLRGIKGRDETKTYTGYDGKDFVRSLEETVAAAEEALIRLVEAYRDPERGYRSKAHPFKSGDRSDYDHLARVREWMIADEAGEGGDD
ncbi:double-strand break repair protein AddB [Chthonobacter albigriseus]|uniref:double-strand break repair protein AddB n=1 Tax=Chthonobacter albigriseus TaxID=1683161 RepID=UPI0015EE666E|nr:double-strand break repair protein AddB [Chthonobacter albigriseus]